ncbi:methionine ABC transporter ATP-binding protein [Pararhodospirillum oryzae]|uniref:Cell division ATP-binding protein FtsE n=1 Tax=Pararhodospirillum oryzae TaxID=478448 RepID=A0A512H455_9PROT|nr:methionine ABC transporter ATP-binding protein [Pararhodospirillum oryzae]GEO80246.1 methionine import ATP-binding protein MetN [Pararhodospirillum oryzae]
MIRTQALTKTFTVASRPLEVLKGVSLSIDAGAIHGIIGRSGAGKSTLVRCLNLLERPTSGQVWVGDEELTALDPAGLRAARHRIGMIFQHFNLWSSRTVADNIALPLELSGWARPERRRRVAELLDLVGLADKANAYPSALSGGQKQRVGIARALATRPSVLLCDEATSALDPETTQAILELLRTINRTFKLTMVLITHEMAVVRTLADRVSVLDQGSVIEEGRTFEVFTRPRTALTRSFVNEGLEHDLPPDLRARLRPAGSEGNTGPEVWHITFTGPAANTPVMSELVQRFGLSLNILHGRIETIQDKPFGQLVVEADGPPAARAAALAALSHKNLSTEVLGHVIAPAHAAA